MKRKINNYDIYKIDNFLIKFGYIILIISIILFIRSVLPELYNIKEIIISATIIIFLFLFIGSIIMLKYGYYFRNKDNMINAILRQMEIAIEVSSIELMDSTGYTSAQLEESIQAINKHGIGYYVWNKDTGIISDGRLRRRMVYVDNCPSCGNRIGKQFPITLDEIPTCPSCGTTLDVNHWNELKYKEFQKIEDNKMISDERDRQNKPKISIPVLIILILLFWPGAIIYILIKNRGNRFNQIL
jgi:hypothetical protein